MDILGFFLILGRKHCLSLLKYFVNYRYFVDVLYQIEEVSCIPIFLSFKNHKWDFPGGTVVKNLPANAGNMGSSPGPGRSHMPQNNYACEPQLLKPVHLEAVLCNKEKPLQ